MDFNEASVRLTLISMVQRNDVKSNDEYLELLSSLEEWISEAMKEDKEGNVTQLHTVN